MKKLISILGLVGIIGLSGIVYAQEENLSMQKSKYEKINIRDIPNVRPERLTSQAVSGQYTYFFYDTDGDNFEDLQIIYMIVSQGYDTDGDQIFSFPRMVLFAKDINRNLRFDKNEKFIVDYTNSQLTNPLLEKKPEPEKKKLSFDGEKKSA